MHQGVEHSDADWKTITHRGIGDPITVNQGRSRPAPCCAGRVVWPSDPWQGCAHPLAAGQTQLDHSQRGAAGSSHSALVTTPPACPCFYQEVQQVLKKC